MTTSVATKSKRTLKPLSKANVHRTLRKPAAKPVFAPAQIRRQVTGLLPERCAAPETIPVRLRIYQPHAREVFVAGAFNNWCPEATPLQPLSGGEWAVELALKPGAYEYRYVVDGRWTDDPLAPSYTLNQYGDLNGVAEVRASA